MRVYYDEITGDVLAVEDFRIGPDGEDDPSPGLYIEIPTIDITNYEHTDYRVIDGSVVKKSQTEIDERLAGEQLIEDRILAQEKVTNKLAFAVDAILRILLRNETALGLKPAEVVGIQEFRTLYADWKAKGGE